MVNTFAMTILMVVLGMSGKSDIVAEIGIVQGATLALFCAFSANARSLIFNPTSRISAESIMASRLTLLIPLAGVAYLLSVVPGAQINACMAIALILRRCVEWLGEVHLSEMERLGDKKFTWNYLILQISLLAGVFTWFLGKFPFPLLGLFIWALAPLTMSARYIWKSFFAIPSALSRISSSILPHLGSTTIIGITVYIFRILILLIAGKEAAGDLFTAFAIGGLTGGVFANALGPSIVLHEQRSGKHHFPFILRVVLYLSLFLGVIIFAAAILELPMLDWTGKAGFFWMATGLSIIGGVIMVYAQRIRLRLLQHDEENDVFGPDVMSNILLIAAVPFVYYLLGMRGMSGLYLLSSVLAFVFYLSSKKEVAEQQPQLIVEKIRMAIPVMLLFPIFFQASNGVFRDTTINYNSGGMLANLPVPLSVLACFAGIVFLGGYKRAFVSFTTIFFTCILMIMAAIISTHANLAQEQAKLVLLIQFILPMFALILGQLYNHEGIDNNSFCYEKMFLWVLAIIVPWHLIATFYQGFLFLSPSLGLFSIYQSFQYVTVVFVSAYLIALFALLGLPKCKFLLFILAPLMAIYIVASMSFLAIGMMLAGVLGFAVFQWISKDVKLPIIFFLIVAILSFSYLHYAKFNSERIALKFVAIAELEKMHLQKQQNLPLDYRLSGGSEKEKRDLAQHKKNLQQEMASIVQLKENEKLYKIKMPLNIRERLNYWRQCLEKIMASPKVLLVGVSEISDRAKFPSAHNYYLDFIYNFGVVAVLPILILLIYTCALIFKYRRAIYLSPDMVGLCFVTLFLLLIDNSLKVGLRQPYPGIFTFFLWGLLFSRLQDLNNKKKSQI